MFSVTMSYMCVARLRLLCTRLMRMAQRTSWRCSLHLIRPCCCSPVPAILLPAKNSLLGRFLNARTNSSALRKVTEESGWTRMGGARPGDAVVCCAARMPAQYHNHTVVPPRRQAEQRAALMKKLHRAGKRNLQNTTMVVNVRDAHSSVALSLDIAPHRWKRAQATV